MQRVLLAALAIGLASCGSPGGAGEQPLANGPSNGGLVGDGAALFRTHCVACHGDQGAGDGPAARYLFPKPRNFTTGKFKIRTTATGDMPLDSDLDGVLRRGIPGTSMPSFAFLTAAERKSLVDHLKTLSVAKLPDGKVINHFANRPNPRAIPVKEAPPATPELLARGAQLYRQQGCAQCHGESGVGDGPSAATLRDDAGYPIPPVDFTRGLYKGGSGVADVYMRFTTGLNGTPMPSFETSLPEKDRWALAHYVKSIERPGRPAIPAQMSEAVIKAVRASALHLNPYDPSWDLVPATEIPMMPLFQRASAPDVVRVRLAHDGKELGVLLEWEDPGVNGITIRPQEFTDAAAVMFSITDPPGHFTMGEKGRPCNIWHWRMDRQMDMAKYLDVEDTYPGMASDDYPLARDGDKVHRAPAAAPSCDETFLTGKGAGNPMSNTERVSAVEDLNSIGFGSLEAQPRAMQNVRGRGAWASGRWRVVFIRSLNSPDDKDAKLQAGKKTSVGFAVWDGGAGDRNGQKSVTYWQVLQLE